ncbi:MAG TPA: PKD domain-containing protein, partial [Acidimicrobiia bacterium]|nr:PKD domain-containing protein [Acidimicrobiia bacterium]
MRRQSWGPRYVAALLCSILVAALLAGPAFAMRLRNSSSSLVLAQPAVVCGTSPSVVLSWTDTDPSVDGTYRVESLPAGGRQKDWQPGPWLGDVRTATVTVANQTGWQYAIEASTRTTRDSNHVNVNVVCAPGDTTAPSVPANLAANAVSCSQVNVSWSASTDTGGAGVKGYRVYRNDGQTTDVAGLSTSDLTVASATTYSYQVSAIDNVTNESAKSAAKSATTPTCPDVTPPSAPANLAGSAPSCSSVNLSWTGSTDTGGSGLAGYRVFRDSALLKTVTGTSTTDSVLSGSNHSYQVFAVDGANNVSAASNSVSVPVPACADTTAPSVPTGVTLAAPSCSQMNVSWSAATDASGIKNYDVYRDGALVGTVAALSYADTGLAGGSVHSWQVRARDNASNVSAFSAAASAGTPTCPDTTAPSVPVSPSATAASCSQVNVSWGASSDTGGSGVKGYIVYRNGVALPLVTTTSKNDTGLAAGTGYSYQVSAVDNAKNESAKSTVASATTPACPDVTPPSTPTASATASGCHQVNVSWSAASDTGGSGLNGYTLYRGDGSIVTVTSLTSFSDMSRNPSTQYTYQVDAVDGAGNHSAKSALASATTPACPNTPPVANAGADKSATAGTSVSFSGSGSSDADGTITSYAWAFGDGATGSGVSTTHTYAAAGQYQVALTVTDNAGATAQDTAIVTITAASASTWAKEWGGSLSDSVSAMATDAAGNAYATGTFRGTMTVGTTTLVAHGDNDFFIVKWTPSGTLAWLQGYGSTGAESPRGVTVDASGNVDVVGFIGVGAGQVANVGGADLTLNGTGDMFVAQYSAATGAHQWSKRFGGQYTSDQAQAVAVDATGNVYVTGMFSGTANFGGGNLSVPFDSDLDLFILKLDKAGNYTWAKHFPNDGNDVGYGIAVDAQANILVTGSLFNSINFTGNPVGSTGTLSSPGSMTDMIVAKFTTDGTYVWSRQGGGQNGNESGSDVAVDSAGNAIVTASAIGSSDFGTGPLPANGSADAIVAKYSAANGSAMWAKRFGGLGNDYASGVAVDGSDNVYMVGDFYSASFVFGTTTLSSPVANEDAYMSKLSSSGN